MAEYWNGTTSTGSWYEHDASSTMSSGVYYYPVCRMILVEDPDCWTDDDCLAFTDLVNNKICVGWTIVMHIKGQVLITDPNVETHTMEEFLPLLYSRASLNDKERIRVFLEEHPIQD